jgi:hypothetical protein
MVKFRLVEVVPQALIADYILVNIRASSPAVTLKLRAMNLGWQRCRQAKL